MEGKRSPAQAWGRVGATAAREEEPGEGWVRWAQESLGTSYAAASQARCFCETAWAAAAATFKSILKVTPEQEREPATPGPA